MTQFLRGTMLPENFSIEGDFTYGSFTDYADVERGLITQPGEALGQKNIDLTVHNDFAIPVFQFDVHPLVGEIPKSFLSLSFNLLKDNSLFGVEQFSIFGHEKMRIYDTGSNKIQKIVLEYDVPNRVFYNEKLKKEYYNFHYADRHQKLIDDRGSSPDEYFEIDVTELTNLHVPFASLYLFYGDNQPVSIRNIMYYKEGDFSIEKTYFDSTLEPIHKVT